MSASIEFDVVATALTEARKVYTGAGSGLVIVGFRQDGFVADTMHRRISQLQVSACIPASVSATTIVVIVVGTIGDLARASQLVDEVAKQIAANGITVAAVIYTRDLSLGTWIDLSRTHPRDGVLPIARHRRRRRRWIPRFAAAVNARARLHRNVDRP
ncbi:hypothetical protein ACIBG0_36920 [Nocardia sp. NPDC050630]|uniref:hypothetical protein n=1 Tax=Nocardia sp. NPDC050630 TaxID=3364321 RepID=UPI0037A5E1E5